MIWENGIEISIISYMKRVASPGSMHDTGCLGLVHWDDPEGGYGEGGGRRVQDGEHMYTCVQARILEWFPMPSSSGFSQPRDRTHVSYVSYTGRQVLYH